VTSTARFEHSTRSRGKGAGNRLSRCCYAHSGIAAYLDEYRGREVQSTRHASHHKADRSPESNQLADQFLRQAVENKVGGLDGLQAARLPLVKLFGRIERLHEKIDEAFGGQPFLPNLPPDCPANRRRFNTFLGEHKKVTKLLGYALELWSLACGLKREDDWIPLLIADIHRRTLQEAWRQDPQTQPFSPGLRPGDGSRARAGKTDRAPVAQIDIHRSGDSSSNKNRAKRCDRWH